MIKHVVKISFILSCFVFVFGAYAQVPKVFEIKKKEFYSVSFSRDSKMLAAGDFLGDISLWNVETGEVKLDEPSSDDLILETCFSPDGFFVAAASRDGSVSLWTVEKGLLDKKFTGHKGAVTSMVFSAEGNYLYTGSDDNTISKWDILKNFKVSEFRGHEDAVSGLSISPDGKTLVSSSYDGTLILWDTELNSKKGKINLGGGKVRGVTFDFTGRYIAAVSDDKTIRIIDIETHTVGLLIRGHKDVAYHVQFSGDGQYLISSSLSGELKFWSAETGDLKKEIKSKDIVKFSVSNDGQTVATVNRVSKVSLYNIADLKIKPAKLKPVVPLFEFVEGENIIRPVKTDAIFNRKKPDLSIVQPKIEEGKEFVLTFDKEILIKGSVKSENGLFELTINNEEVIPVHDNFSHMVKLAFGNNTITVKAVDIFNNVKTQTFVIQRQIKLDNHNDTLARKAQDFALLICTDEYTSWGKLSNPIFDGTTIKEVLEKNYGFKVEMVKNPTRSEVYTILRQYSKMQFSDDDQLFIFIAGHGEFDDVFKEGYIVTKDSKLNDENKESYISHSNLRTIINNIPCNHILLTMDVCFGGTFIQEVAGDSRGRQHFLNSGTNREKFIENKLKYNTRRFITSGAKEYVPDGRPGHHSPFSRRFIEALHTNGGEDGVLTIGELYNSVENTVPHPFIGEFGNNKPGSDFLFIQKDWVGK